MIMWVSGYLLPWISGFLIFGILLMMGDMYLVKNETKPWVPSYRKWYNRSRKPEDHLPEGTMGWFYGQTLSRWHNRALVISGFQSLFSVYYGANALFEFIAFLVEAWAVLPGLWLGRYAFNLLWKQDEYIKKADEFRERVSASGITGIGASIGSTVADAVAKTVARVTPAAAHEPAESTPAKPVPKSEDMSAASILQRHKEGRQV